MSGIGNSSIGVNVDKNGKQYKPNGTGTTVAGVVAGGAPLDFSGNCKPIPNTSFFATAKAVAKKDPTITRRVR